MCACLIRSSRRVFGFGNVASTERRTDRPINQSTAHTRNDDGYPTSHTPTLSIDRWLAFRSPWRRRPTPSTRQSPRPPLPPRYDTAFSPSNVHTYIHHGVPSPLPLWSIDRHQQPPPPTKTEQPPQKQQVTRDRVVSTWTWEETFPTGPLPIDFGSGYPSDQRASDWLAKHSDPLFGFPSLIRFSWSTAREHMERHCAPVAWQHEEDEDEGALPPGTASIEAFIKKRPTPAGAAAAHAPGAGGNVGGNGKKARKRAKYFSQRHVEVVGSF